MPTERELEVLRLYAAGMTQQAVGEQLYVCTDTVKQALRSVRFKLGARNTTHAVALAVGHGLIRCPASLADATSTF